MATCQGKTKDGRPCSRDTKDGSLYCWQHEPDKIEDWREVYECLKQASPQERTKIVLGLIEEHPEGKLELPYRDGVHANLQGVDLSNKTLEDADLRGAHLGRANLQSTNLQSANFQGVDLGDADLQGAYLEDANLQRANLQGAKMVGAYLGKADLQNADLRGAKLGSTNLQGANLQDAHLQGAFLSRANLQNTNLWGANLQGANLEDANLQHANLQRANLQGAQLGRANFQRAHMWGVWLQGAHMWGVQLQDADLLSAELQGADLVNANLQGARMPNANLQGANLRDAHLQQVDLFFCNIVNIFISQAWLDRTRLRWEQLGGAIGEELTGEYKSAQYGYLTLKQNFDDLGDYDAASKAYCKERRMEKLTHWPPSHTIKYYMEELSNSEDKSWRGKFQRFYFYLRHFALYISDWFIELLCDYGESIWRVLAWMTVVLFVIGPALVGWRGQLRWPEENYNLYFSLPTPWQRWGYAYVQNVLYMLDTFTTADFAQLEPANDLVRLISGFLAMIGIFLVGLLGFVVGNRIRRS